jgi:O-antigen chain-terminating methyltransferase
VTPKSDIAELVAEVPELYQPVFWHRSISGAAARLCNDRLQHILQVYDTYRNEIGCTVRVLDLGCAQGFFSFARAERGAEVVGIDHLRENINVCRALAAERAAARVRFEEGSIENLAAYL